MSEYEEAMDPDRPIIDPHLHFWELLPEPGEPRPAQRFLFEEARRAIAASGHAITHTVFVECGQMYRPDGPEELRSLGETEFANGIAAMSASGRYGGTLLGHRIVGSADLRLGEAVRPVLEAHCERAGERFRGIRMAMAHSEEGLFGFPCDPALKGVMRSDAVIAGARVLADMGLSLDVWCVHGQLPDLVALADVVPELAIVLDHIGTPERSGRWADRGDEALAEWSGHIGELARRPNVVIKIGGMGMHTAKMIGTDQREASSEALADAWRARVETCIAAFGAARAMFESNFPPDRDSGSYGATWNAFKRLASGYSEEEQDALFRQTAARTYRIET